MEPFKSHRGKLALLNQSDINTDLIIPARYLKRIERTGYGPLLFADKRYLADQAPEADSPEQGGIPDPSFPLNKPEAVGSTILVVGKNFGCGSSREHAVWAVAQAGFRAIIAPALNEGFADIFEANAYNNGLLPIELPHDSWAEIARAAGSTEGAEATIDLEACTITLHPTGGPESTYPFTVPEENRRRLLSGLDMVDVTLEHEAQIRAFERSALAKNAPRHN